MSATSEFKPHRVQLVNRYKFVQENSLWLERLYTLLGHITASKDKKKNNYSLEYIDLLGHLSFDILTWKDQIIAFCGVYSGGRYPAGSFRVLNRCYVTPEFRTKNLGRFSALNSQYLLSEQLAEFSEEIEFPFISREGLLGYHFLKKWADKFSPGKSWLVSEEMIHLVPHSSDSPAYQHISYPPHADHLKFFKKISRNDWQKLYES
jgi:hypothetical protein